MKLLECLPISWIQLYEGSTHRCILVTILQYSLFFYYNARKGKYTFCWCIYILSKTEVPWDQDSSISKFYSPIVRSYKLLLVYIRLWEKCKYILSPMKSIFKFQCLRIILISQMSIKIGIVCFIQCSLFSFCERTHDYQTKTRRLEVLTHW